MIGWRLALKQLLLRTKSMYLVSETVQPKVCIESISPDHVFSAHSNVEVYNASSRLIVERVVDGYNGTIAAYGQSGAGKTHSLLGTETEQGVLQLAVSHLLQLINEVFRQFFVNAIVRNFSEHLFNTWSK